MEQLGGPPPPSTLTHARAATHTPDVRLSTRHGPRGELGQPGPPTGCCGGLRWGFCVPSEVLADGSVGTAGTVAARMPCLSPGLLERPWKRTRHRAEPEC